VKLLRWYLPADNGPMLRHQALQQILVTVIGEQNTSDLDICMGNLAHRWTYLCPLVVKGNSWAGQRRVLVLVRIVALRNHLEYMYPIWKSKPLP
jgi:hypothetical protein